MPSPKRWYPVSHDLLHDPELHEIERKLGREVGPKFIKLWLWFLSRLDLNDNALNLTQENLRSGCRVANMHLKSGIKAVNMMHECGWITPNMPLNSTIKTSFEAPKYWKYHKSRDSENSPPNLSEPSERKRKEKISLSLGNGQANSDPEKPPPPPDDPTDRYEWFKRWKINPADYKQ